MTINSAEYGFFSVFACDRLCGPTTTFDEAKATSEVLEAGEENDSYLSEAGYPSNVHRQQRESPEDATTGCNPEVCRMTSGICVDCTRCWQHCTCVVSRRKEMVAPFRTFACNPTVCRPIVCGDCSRCIDHCTCKWPRQRQAHGQEDIVHSNEGNNRRVIRRTPSLMNYRN